MCQVCSVDYQDHMQGLYSVAGLTQSSLLAGIYVYWRYCMDVYRHAQHAPFTIVCWLVFSDLAWTVSCTCLST